MPLAFANRYAATSVESLNDPLFVQAAQKLAGRMAAQPSVDVSARVGELFLFARPASPSPRNSGPCATCMKRLARNTRNSRKQAARLGSGSHAQSADAAAWYVVARTILNTDEVITRE